MHVGVGTRIYIYMGLDVFTNYVRESDKLRKGDAHLTTPSCDLMNSTIAFRLASAVGSLNASCNSTLCSRFNLSALKSCFTRSHRLVCCVGDSFEGAARSSSTFWETDAAETSPTGVAVREVVRRGMIASFQCFSILMSMYEVDRCVGGLVSVCGPALSIGGNLVMLMYECYRW